MPVLAIATPAAIAAAPMNVQGFSLVPSGTVSPAAGGGPPQPQAVPNGMSPNGKRPRSDEAAVSGRPPLSVPELSTAVLEVQPLVRSTTEAVQWNCDLLNAVIGRVNSLEAWTKVAEPQITAAAQFESTNSEKLAELTGFGDQLKTAFSALEGVAAEADVRFRTEIGQVTKLLDQAVGTLKRQVDALEATTRATQAVPLSAAAAAVTPQAAPGLGPHADQLTELERRTTELAQVSGQTRERLQEAERCLHDHDQGTRALTAPQVSWT